MHATTWIAAFAALFAPCSARAADDIFELWLNPSIAAGVGGGEAELETAQRMRDGRDDTYFVRLWYGRPVAKGITVQGGIEQRWQRRSEERRLLQQLSAKTGVVRVRSRLEQRFVESDARMGLRFRQRIGVSVPLSADGDTALVANAESFFTLRAGNPGGDTGLTALRTYVGFERALNDAVEVGVGYMRAQEFRPGAADRVGHAPFVGLTISL